MTDTQTLDDLPQPEREATVHPDDLEVDGDNPNEQNDETFGLLCENIRKKGWIGNAIVADTDGVIADGEHRWRAAQEIGLDEVPVKFYDIDDAERRLWRQELNKISGEHDSKRDALEYDYLLDNGKADDVQALTNAADEDLDELLAEIKMDRSSPVAYEYDPDHNVYFEDCVEGMGERLDDDSVDCVITDPPYGADVGGELFASNSDRADTKHSDTIENDADADDAIQLFRDTLTEIERVTDHDAHLYIYTYFRAYPQFATVLEESEYNLRNCIVWDKAQNAYPNGNVYAYSHEFIMFATREGCGRLLDNKTQDVFDHQGARYEYSDGRQAHPTQKPLAQTSDLLTNSTREGDTVLDPFMGSGTTAVAAIQNNRDYVGFELDEENYRSVIERRIGEAKRQRDANTNQDTAEADD